MNTNNNNQILSFEEQRAVKWFLSMFYLIYIFYEVFYYYIYKVYILNSDPGLNNMFSYIMYLFMIAILPVVYYIHKRGKVYLVKYIFFFGYLLLSTFNDIMIYFGTNLLYQSGNAVEVLIILFSPIFVNTRFFWVVSLGMVTKYSLVGLVLRSAEVLLPITLFIVLSIIAFILLKRFQSYVRAIKTSYDQQLEGIVKGVIATIELKDPYTRGHSERVAHYAYSLAMATGKYSKDDLKPFQYACLLHDIGKVNIPDQILMKPARLTNEEYETIKTHPKVGANAIEKVKGLTKESIEVIQSHHERWDGKGYPMGLKEDNTPFLARVVSIADAFDAMTSSRSYRPALTVNEAFDRIIEGKGTQFDPELVDLFKKIYPEWVDFHKSYSWQDEQVHF